MNAAPPCIRRLPRALLAAVLLAVLPAAAQEGRWFNAVDNSWTNAANWLGGTLPANGVTGRALFIAGLVAVNQDSGGPWTLNYLELNSTYLFPPAGEIRFDGAAPSMRILGGTTVFDTAVAFNQPMTFDGTPGTATFNNISANGGGITKLGTSTVVITPTNLALGPVVIQAGTLTTGQTPVNATRTLTMTGGNLNTGPAYWHTLDGTGAIALAAGTTEIGAGGTFNGGIASAGELFVSGGTLTLLGNNTFTGGVRLAAGNLSIGNGATGTFPSGPVTFNAGNGTLTLNPTAPATITTVNAPVGTTPVFIVNGGTINVVGPMNFGDGNVTVNGGAVAANSLSAGGVLTVAAPGSFTVNLANVRGLAGNGNLVANLQLQVNNVADFVFSGVVSGAGQLIKDGSGILTLSGNNTYTGTTTVGAGTVRVNGSITSSVVVGVGATLGGSGTVNGPVAIQAGANLTPGTSPGILNTGSLNLAGILNAEIEGSAPGTGYDRINVTGTVTLTNPTLSLSGAHVPVLGDEFILISNDAADAVAGTFAGLPEGATFTFNGRLVRITYVGGDGNDVSIVPVTFNATSFANAGGTIAPLGSVPVLTGGTTAFTLTANTGFTILPVTGTCGGNLVGNVFTTNAVTANCTVIATFLVNTYTVTASAGANGTIAPLGAVPVNHGGTAVFTVTPAATYSASVGGTCGGTLVGTTYTTNPIIGPCTVVATFSQVTFTVTPSAGPNGAITPNTPQTVAQNGTATFTVTPNAGYSAFVGGTCGGTLVGNTYTTSAIAANCTVVAVFDPIPTTTFTGPTATGTGNATVSITGGGSTCGFAPQGSGALQSAFFIPVQGHAKSPPAGTAPAGIAFAHGLLDFVLVNCSQASPVTFTVTYPSALPPGTQYWKYGPEPGNTTPHWYVLPATISGTTATFTITDGGQGDDDLSANGTIVDQGGPGFPVGDSAQQTPTLSEWALIALALAMLGFGMTSTRRRPVAR